MTEDRNEALADAVLDAWQSGAEVDFAIATADKSARSELLALERAALLAAAATGAERALAQPMRQELFSRLLQAGLSFQQPSPAPERATPGRTPPTRRVLPFLLGAAAGVAASWLALATVDSPRVGDRRAEFLANGRHARMEWKPGTSQVHGTVHGDVVWCTERQEGYLRIDGLEPLPEGKQYQLWIVDAERQGAPVDGGLFDLASRDDNVVAIAAKLPVRAAKTFVVTVEPRGGVVVSEQKDVVAVASL